MEIRKLSYILIAFFLSNFTFAIDVSEGERIMLLQTRERYILNPSSLFYNLRNKWYVSLEDFFQDTGFEIKISYDTQYAEGFVLSEDRTFVIDFPRDIIKYKDKIIHFQKDDFIDNNEEYLLEMSVLEQFLPLKFEIDSLTSTVTLNTFEDLPPVALKKREDKQIQGNKEKPTYPIEENTRKWLDGFNLGHDLRAGAQRTKGAKQSFYSHQTSLSGEVAKFEFFGQYSGSNSASSDTWLSLERNDPNERIFGDLSLSNVTLLNFNSISSPLIGGGDRITGLSFTNRTLKEPTNFTTQDFVGPLERGWEVELYRNDILIGKQRGEVNNQRYEFLKTDLFYGRNDFKFIFYGPKGQIVFKERKIQINQDYVKTGKTLYEGQIGKDRNGANYQYLRLNKTILNQIRIEPFYLRKRLSTFSEDKRTFLGINASSFLGSNLINTNIVRSDKNSAIKGSITSILGRTNNTLTYTFNNGLTTDELGVTSPIKQRAELLTIAPLFGHIQLYNKVELTKYDLIENWNKEVRTRLSYNKSSSLLSYEFQYANEDFNHQVQYRYTKDRKSFRASQRFTKEDLLETEIGLSKYLRESYSISGNLTYFKQSQNLQASAILTKQFNKFSLGLNLEQDLSNDQRIALNFNFGLNFYQNKGMEFYGRPTSEYANVKAVVFMDLNGNEIHDSNEPLIENAVARVLTSTKKEVTDENGECYFTFLRGGRKVDVKVSMENNDNIYLNSTFDGKSVWLRRGKTASVYFPISIKGEVEGELILIDDKIKLKDVEVELITGERKERIRVERDGYFYIPKVPPGEHSINITCEACKNKSISKPFTMPEEGDSLFIEGLEVL